MIQIGTDCRYFQKIAATNTTAGSQLLFSLLFRESMSQNSKGTQNLEDAVSTSYGFLLSSKEDGDQTFTEGRNKWIRHLNRIAICAILICLGASQNYVKCSDISYTAFNLGRKRYQARTKTSL